jgi:uncharacterized protein (DUF736 family)
VQVLAGELAREKREIVFASGRLRSISLVGELLFQSKLEHKALLTPEEELKQKAGHFRVERGPVRIGAARLVRFHIGR